MRIIRLLAAVSLAMGLLGCGQKGALVLPDAQHPHKKIGTGKPAQSPTPAPGSPTPTTPAPVAPTPQS